MLQQKLLKTILSYNLIKWETHTHTKLTHPEYKEDEKKITHTLTAIRLFDRYFSFGPETIY